MVQYLVGGWYQTDQGQWAQTETEKVFSEHQEMIFYPEGDQALAWVAPTCCGISILGELSDMVLGSWL